MSHILDKHKRALVGLVNLIRELAMNHVTVNDPAHYGAFQVAVKLLKEDVENPPQDQFSPTELQLIGVVLGNHATDLKAREGLGVEDLKYAAELHRIGDKADKMRKPNGRKEKR